MVTNKKEGEVIEGLSNSQNNENPLIIKEGKIKRNSLNISGVTKYYDLDIEINEKEVSIVIIYDYDSNTDSYNLTEWTTQDCINAVEREQIDEYIQDLDFSEATYE